MGNLLSVTVGSMMITTTWDDLKRIPWQAVFRCAAEYKQNNPSHNDRYYQEYMIETWGIDHATEHIRITDEQKYMMFLLRWSE